MVEKRIVINGILIPPGYTQVMRNVDLEGLDSRKLRYFDDDYPFIFDPENREYLAFYVRCLEDTKRLAEALHKELTKLGIAVWVRRRRVPSSKKNYRRMNFLVRPVFFTSNEEKNEENRIQGKVNEDTFIIHIDERNIIQEIRFWKRGISSQEIYKNRILIWQGLAEQKSMLEGSWGNWGAVARIIAEIIRREFRPLDLTALS